MSINSLDDVRPGDFMIAGQSSAPAKLVVYGGQLLLHDHFRVGRVVAGHAAMVIPGGKIVEAMPHGARARFLTPADWTASHAFFRLPEDYAEQALDAAAIAQAMIGVKYSIASYAYLAAYIDGFKSEWLAKRIDRRELATTDVLPSGRVLTWARPVEAICSVLAEQCWTITGKQVIRGTVPQVVTPGMLAEQLWTYPGVIRGGLGVL